MEILLLGYFSFDKDFLDTLLYNTVCFKPGLQFSIVIHRFRNDEPQIPDLFNELQKQIIVNHIVVVLPTLDIRIKQGSI